MDGCADSRSKEVGVKNKKRIPIWVYVVGGVVVLVAGEAGRRVRKDHKKRRTLSSVQSATPIVA